MKTNHYLLLIAAAVMLSACNKDDEAANLSDEDKYTKGFELEVGGTPENCTWNMAQRHSITVYPGEAKTVKVYTLRTDKYQLVADYSRIDGPTTIEFDAQCYADEFLVDIDGRKYIVTSGGTVDADNTPDAPESVEIDSEPFGWYMLVENNYDGEYQSRFEADYDFNDLVIRISSVVTDDGVKVKISPKACGDSQIFYLHLNFEGSDELLWPDNLPGDIDCEMHQWFSIKDFRTRVNTGPMYNKNGDEVIYNSDGGWATQDALLKFTYSKEMTLSKNWSMCDFSMCNTGYEGNILGYSGLYVTVGTFKDAATLLKQSEPEGIALAMTIAGKTPHVMLVPDEGYNGRWKWAAEEYSIAMAYGSFGNWTRAPKDLNYVKWNTFEPIMPDYVY